MEYGPDISSHSPWHPPWKRGLWATKDMSPPLQGDSIALTQDSLALPLGATEEGWAGGVSHPTYVYGVAPVNPGSSGADWPTQRKSPSSTLRHTDAALCQLGQDKGGKGGEMLGAIPQPPWGNRQSWGGRGETPCWRKGAGGRNTALEAGHTAPRQNLSKEVWELTRPVARVQGRVGVGGDGIGKGHGSVPAIHQSFHKSY